MRKLNFDKSLIVGLLLVVLIIGGGVLLKGQQNKTVEIVTDQQEYDNGASLKLKIRNLLAANICFSSCYPYYLEWKTDQNNSESWTPYSYHSCPYEDQIKKCIDSGSTKAFKISLPKLKEGAHRISVPICQNCQPGEKFQENKRLYSNEFEIR